MLSVAVTSDIVSNKSTCARWRTTWNITLYASLHSGHASVDNDNNNHVHAEIMPFGRGWDDDISDWYVADIDRIGRISQDIWYVCLIDSGTLLWGAWMNVFWLRAHIMNYRYKFVWSCQKHWKYNRALFKLHFIQLYFLKFKLFMLFDPVCVSGKIIQT